MSRGRLGPASRASSCRVRKNEARPPGPDSRSATLPMMACSRASQAGGAGGGRALIAGAVAAGTGAVTKLVKLHTQHDQIIRAAGLTSPVTIGAIAASTGPRTPRHSRLQCVVGDRRQHRLRRAPRTVRAAAGGIWACSRSACSASSGAASTSMSGGSAGAVTFSCRGPRQRGALHRGVDHHDDERDVKYPGGRRAPRSRPRRPAGGRSRLRSARATAGGGRCR